MAITSNADIIRKLFSEINRASDRGYAAFRFQNEMVERLEYYIVQWSDCQANQGPNWDQQAEVLRTYIDNQIGLIRDYRIALFRATKAANQSQKSAKPQVKDMKSKIPAKSKDALKLVSDMTVLPDKADDQVD